MEQFKNSDGTQIVFGLIKTIQENKAYLSEIDGAIGDGDHGINMNKGFTLAYDRLIDKEVDFSGALKTLGTILLTEIGGSMGPLYGTFFRNMAKKAEDEITQEVFARMLRNAYEGLSELGGAKVGDKTLMDTLVPALEAFENSCDHGESFSVALEKMQEAAEEGKNSTYDLVAKIGRASRLGERSKGCLDAGATSCNLIIQSMAEDIKILI